MNKKVLTKSLAVVIGISLLGGIPFANAFAWGGDDHHYRGHGGVTVRVGYNSRYNFDRGRFYRRTLFGYVYVPAPVGVVITTLPFGYSTVYYGGTRYYYYNNIYYRDCPTGYVVAPAPAAISSTEVYTLINVPNSNGSYTPVKLVKVDTGYIGPQGEFYQDHPTVEQLRALYGK
ncbi:MAG: DUF6515 family protein [Candidatus Omnitrophica bacterium]|nr:DUF6515 family protein [Candidatus Omnitrophota bacterium]